MSTSIPSLASCTPEELSRYLLENRFKGNATETATFLLQAIDNVPNIEEINDALANSNDDDDESENENTAEMSPENKISNLLGEEICTIPDIDPNNDTNNHSNTPYYVSAITPRSKFKIQMFDKGCIMKNDKDEQILIPSAQVENVIMFPKREDCLKSLKRTKNNRSIFEIPGSMVLVVFKDQEEENGNDVDNIIAFRQKKLKQLCFQLPQHYSHNPIEDESLNEAEVAKLIVDRFESSWCNLFKTSFDLKDVLKVYNPKVNAVNDKFQFQSDQGDNNTSLMQGGMPFVKCYSGINDGVLYPLEEGLLFFKPPQFYHRSKLHSIQCGRGSGGSSRFVDLVITLDDEENDDHKESMEFTNIDREELQCLNNYIHNILIKAMAKDAEESSVDDEDIEDTKDNNDANDDGEENLEHRETRKRSKTLRNASMHARKATKAQLQATNSDEESDEDDDDFVKVNSDEDDEENDTSDEEHFDDNEEEIIMDDSDDENIVDEYSRKRKTERKASKYARKATKLQMDSSPVNPDESDEEDDEDFIRIDSDEDNEEDTDTESEE